jgi:hypothetical protein
VLLITLHLALRQLVVHSVPVLMLTHTIYAVRLYYVFAVQVKSGTIFDDIIVTDSLEEAQALANEGWATWKDAEKAVEDEISTKVTHCSYHRLH